MFGSGENLKWERIHVSTWIGMLRVPLSGKIRRVDVKIYPMRILPYAQVRGREEGVGVKLGRPRRA